MTDSPNPLRRATWVDALSARFRAGERPPLRRTRRRVSAKGLIRAAFGIAGLIAAAVLLVSGAGFSYLASGPVSLESLKPRIVASLEERLGGKYRVAIGPASLMNGPHGLGVGFGGIEIRDLEGRPVVRAPGGRVSLDVLALLTLDIKVRRLELDGLDLKLHVHRDGALSVAATPDDAAPIDLGKAPAAAPAVDVGLVLAGLIDEVAGARQALDHVGLVKGRLEIDNEALGVSSVYDDLTLAFDRAGSTAEVALSARGPSGKWSLSAKARAGASRSLSVDAHDLALDDFLRLDAHRPPFESDMPISFKFDAALTPAGAMQSLNGAFSFGAGVIKLDDPDAEPFLADEATGKVAWDPAAKFYRIDHVEILSGATHIRFGGAVTPPDASDPNWRGRLESNDIVFDAERPGERPVTIDKATLDAHFSPAEQRVTLDKLSLHGPHLQGSMTADIAAVEGGATMKVGLEVGPSAIADILRIWPSNINPDGRNWCLQNLRGGEVVSGAMKVDWDAAATAAAFAKQVVPADSVHGEFAVRDASVQLLPSLPVATNVDFAGVLTGRSFAVTGKHGVLDFAPGRRIVGSDIYFKIPDTRPATVVPSEGGARLTGGADALAELLGREPIKRFAAGAPDPANVKGQFQGQLVLFLGLGKSVKPEDQKFRAEGSLANLSLDKFMANEKIEQGALDLTADSDGFKLAGQAVVNGIPAKLELVKGPTDDGAVTMNMTLDDAARAKLGLTAGPKVTGPMAVRVKTSLVKSAGADFDVDLAKAVIESPDGATLKPAGRPGKATFTMKSLPEGMAISAITLDSGPLSLRGSMQLAADGALQSAKLSQLRMNSGDELKVDLTGGPVLKAVVRGASLDARSIVKGLIGREQAMGDAHDMDLDVKLASVGGFNHQTITQFDFSGARRGGSFKSLDLRGRIEGASLVARGGETGVINLHSEDAGALAKFLDVYTKLEGGSLELQLRPSSEGARGVATIKRFSVRNEAALKQLSASAPSTGSSFRDFGRGSATDADVVHFDRLSANFTRNASRLELRDGVVFNPAFGLTTQGYLDFTHDKMDLSGVFVPAYSLNSALNHIPVVGLLLGGGGNEGVFAVNYRISGQASSPTLNVNPLSGMTPGILRKLFGAFDGTSPPVNSYAPVGEGQ